MIAKLLYSAITFLRVCSLNLRASMGSISLKLFENKSGTVWWNSGKVMVQEWGGTIEQSRWNSGTLVVEQCGTVEQSWWNSVVEKWNSHGRTVWWNRGTLVVEQCNETVEQ